MIFSNSICFAQLNWMASYFGQTENEILNLINSKKNSAFKTSLYDRNANEIIFIWGVREGDFQFSCKSTCYFKNEVFYKVKQEYKTFGKTEAWEPFEGDVKELENNFYDVHNGQWEYLWEDGTIRLFDISVPNNNRFGIKYSTTDDYGKSPKDYGGKYVEYSKILHYSKPGQKVSVKLQFGGGVTGGIDRGQAKYTMTTEFQ